MAIRVTSVTERPNTNVEFWSFDAAARAHLKTTFKDTGKILSRTSTTSENGLVKTVVRTFVDRAAFDEFKNDPVRIAAVASRDAYNTANGITSSSSIITVEL